MPGDPQECREHAQQCLRLAKSAQSLIARMRWEGVAHSWLRLASDLERAKALNVTETRLRKTG